MHAVFLAMLMLVSSSTHKAKTLALNLPGKSAPAVRRERHTPPMRHDMNATSPTASLKATLRR